MEKNIESIENVKGTLLNTRSICSKCAVIADDEGRVATSMDWHDVIANINATLRALNVL